MKLFYLVLLILLISSCSKETIKIKNDGIEKIDVKDTYIRTTKVETNGETEEMIKEPKIDIISPKDNEVIKNSTIFVKLSISDFKLVTPDRYPKKGQGHVQVWIDNMEFRGSRTEFVFENESNGTHIIKAELMLSNNTVLPYSKTIKVFVNKTWKDF